MKPKIFIPLVALVFFAAAGKVAEPGANVKEPVTGIEFPSEVRFSQDSEDYTLQLTGVAARTKWFFRVYAVANYLEPQKGTGALDRAKILVDGPAKQMTIQYARRVPAQKITEVLREDFEENTTPAEYRKIKAQVEQMLAYFVSPVEKGDVFVMRWLSGGRVYLELNSKMLGHAESELFARTLWSIWLGKHSVVDVEALTANMSGGTDA